MPSKLDGITISIMGFFDGTRLPMQDVYDSSRIDMDSQLRCTVHLWWSLIRSGVVVLFGSAIKLGRQLTATKI